ncbi:hypothetical protein [Longispora albida]|uniref:hypothetical protein n=1 Tax=Longispora albida TaxID=203523 RepID=UPI00036AA67B|nr:hypothetical protein [Longispora albida]
MQLHGDRITAPKNLMIRDIMVNNSCLLITLDRALFLREGETIQLEDHQPVVERHDGTTLRPSCTSAAVRWSYKLL